MPDTQLELVTIPDVHLASVGRWVCSTGIWECAPDDLASIVEAQDDPGIRTPIVKLGHRDTLHGIDAPAVGLIENLHLSDDGLELYGDLVGVPKWLAEVMASAYPSRSVEVAQDYTGATGHAHRAVLTALALLGETAPAIASLDDVRALYEGQYEELVAASKAAGAHVVVVNASVSIDGVRQAFYDKLPAGSWAWIRECWSDFLVVDNDEGELYKIPWSEANGTITFGTPEEVVVEYVPAPSDAEDVGEAGMLLLSRFVMRDPRLVRASKENTVELKDLLAVVGLPETATEDEYMARLDELAPLATTPAPAPVPTPAPIVGLPDGVTAVDSEQFGELVNAARDGREARQILARQERDAFLDVAVKAGKFPPVRLAHWQAAWDADPAGTKATVDTLAAGLIPTDPNGTGYMPSVEAMSDDALWTQFESAFAGINGTEA